MNFQRGSHKEELEINLIPMIDVLLVILIFMMVTTTFSQISELQINLPSADSKAQDETPAQVTVGVDAKGRYAINGTALGGADVETLGNALKNAAGKTPDPVIVINADAQATHQSVINVMEAARVVGYSRITFATQSTTSNR